MRGTCKYLNKIDKIEEYIDFKLASVFRLDEENNIPTNSTLNKKNSNIFGQFNFKPIKNISLGYDFSLTNDLNKFEYNSLITTMNLGNFVTTFDFLEERGVVGNTNIIQNTTKYDLNNQNSISFNARRNRRENQRRSRDEEGTRETGLGRRFEATTD